MATGPQSVVSRLGKTVAHRQASHGVCGLELTRLRVATTTDHQQAAGGQEAEGCRLRNRNVYVVDEATRGTVNK
jgi:hypothetical protein